MTAWLLCCNHQRQILFRETPDQALREFSCKRCVTFDLANERWRYGDIRIYRAREEDAKAIAERHAAPSKRTAPEQLDWVGRR